jgi:hypothetical protein
VLVSLRIDGCIKASVRLTLPPPIRNRAPAAIERSTRTDRFRSAASKQSGPSVVEAIPM